MKNQNGVAIFSGGGLGLAVGLFMGLTVSPVVGVVIGAITSSLALFLGFGDAQHSTVKSLRIGAFGIAAALSALLGLYMRSHELLSPSVQSLYDTYRAIDFTEEEARAFVKFKKLGIIDPDWKMAFADGNAANDSTGNSQPTAAIVTQGAMSMLFSDEVSAEGCDVFTFHDQSTLDEIKADFDLVNDPGWNGVFKNVTETFAKNQQASVLSFVVNQYCEQKPECTGLNAIDEKTNMNQFETVLKKAGAKWGSIYEASSSFSDQTRRQVLFLLTKTVCNED